MNEENKIFSERPLLFDGRVVMRLTRVISDFYSNLSKYPFL
jgi:hypothetical protein